MPADEWIWTPHSSTTLKREPRILKAQYGGNYQQRGQDGRNNAPLMISLSYTNIPTSQAKLMDDLLTTKGGWQRITWTPSGSWSVLGQLYWFCDDWQSPFNGGLVNSFSAVFEQANAP